LKCRTKWKDMKFCDRAKIGKLARSWEEKPRARRIIYQIFSEKTWIGIIMIASQMINSGDRHAGEMRVTKPWFTIFRIEVIKVINTLVTRCPSDETLKIQTFFLGIWNKSEYGALKLISELSRIVLLTNWSMISLSCIHSETGSNKGHEYISKFGLFN